MTRTLTTTAALAAVALSVGFLHSTAHAAVTVPTVATYDPIANTNQVDRNANGNALVDLGDNSVAGFTTDVAAAFATDDGGVINFDSTTANNITGPINATYGVSQSKTLAIGVSTTGGPTFNFQTSANISQISGNNFFLASTSTNPNSITFTFGTITGGDTGEFVTRAGFTVLGRISGNSTNVSATATFSDSTTATLGPVAFTSDSTAATQDTFYGFSAPTGESISSITITNSGSADTRRGIDDFGFITAIPEPASLALLGLGGLGLLARRRR